MAHTPKDVKANAHFNPALAAAALRKLVADVFPEFPFVYRPRDENLPQAGGNLDFLSADLSRVERTRPATGEEVAMLMAFETVRVRLSELLLAKAVNLSVAEGRVSDYDALLSDALKWAPELAAVPNPDRLMHLRALVRGEELGVTASAPQRQAPKGDITQTHDTMAAIRAKEFRSGATPQNVQKADRILGTPGEEFA